MFLNAFFASQEWVDQFLAALIKDNMSLRPGFKNDTYITSPREQKVSFVLSAFIELDKNTTEQMKGHIPLILKRESLHCLGFVISDNPPQETYIVGGFLPSLESEMQKEERMV